MARKKVIKKKPTEFSLDCPCGARAPVFELENGYMAHCADCGSVAFFKNPQLLERLRYGGQICPHNPEAKPCRGGHTTWCSVCRVRRFFYDTQEGK